MADLKISALTASTTPLAGTEVLPIVQSGTTKQVSVANLTAGRAIAATNITASGEITSTTNDARISLYRATGTNYFDWASGQPLAFGTQTSSGGAGRVNKVNFTDAGNIEIANGNLVIGTSGKGIDFSATAGTGTSELLADYEEGTWTPTDGSGAGLVFTTQDARYTKIGRLVTISASITYPVTADASDAIIAGLPFTTFNGTSGVDGGGTSFTDSATALMFLIAKNTTSFDIRANAGGATRKNVNMSTLTIRFTLTYTAA